MREAIYVTDTNAVVIKDFTGRRYSPDRLRPNMPEGSRWIIRWGARRKRWEVYDVRRYILNPGTGQFWGAPPPRVTTEHRDAAIGFALLMP